ncbi:hypothetical protein DES40_2193 [Litorimonas taeanensis]|uniref:Uncharacterized protein n=1 Tax=Litorimonas taeanensis TaxID=568099 RepID=A0A420WEF9_9PROT|nr:hypothetical protein DES40_2193 [Litorimonas taeanensis]
MRYEFCAEIDYLLEIDSSYLDIVIAQSLIKSDFFEPRDGANALNHRGAVLRKGDFAHRLGCGVDSY